MNNAELFSAESIDSITVVVPEFDRWYERYPKKQGKSKARERWAKMSAADRVAAFEALDGWEHYAVRCPTGSKYVPMASTWLNQRRWEDDAPVIESERIESKSQQALRNVLQRKMLG